MGVYKKDYKFTTSGQGTYEITQSVADGLDESKLSNGVVSVFLRHTSCSLVLMENADPSARADLERYLSKLVPENDPDFTHTYEGSDDMPSHIKMALTRTSETIPFYEGALQLGTWQGLFLWEHRSMPHTRDLIFSYLGN